MRQVDEIRSGMNDKLHKWEEQSKELISAFIHRFGGHRFEQMLATGRDRIVRAISPTPSRYYLVLTVNQVPVSVRDLFSRIREFFFIPDMESSIKKRDAKLVSDASLK
jgi:hypothetical protein